MPVNCARGGILPGWIWLLPDRLSKKVFCSFVCFSPSSALLYILLCREKCMGDFLNSDIYGHDRCLLLPDQVQVFPLGIQGRS